MSAGLAARAGALAAYQESMCCRPMVRGSDGAEIPLHLERREMRVELVEFTLLDGGEVIAKRTTEIGGRELTLPEALDGSRPMDG
jgi:hypothetical protein